MRILPCLVGCAAVAAAAVGGSVAQAPPLSLSVQDTRFEIADLERGPTVRFTISPPPNANETDDVAMCLNGRFDRTALSARGRRECSGTYLTAQSINGQLFTRLGQAGRYEAVAFRSRPRPPSSVSNVITFVAVDPCRLKAVRLSLTPRTASLPGEPMSCSSGGHWGRADLRGEDGSVLRLVGPRSASWLFCGAFSPSGCLSYRVSLGRPVFLLSTTGPTSNLSYRLGPRLGSFVTVAQTSLLSTASIGRVDAMLTHRNRATTARVRRGALVVFNRLGPELLVGHIARRCRTRPTLRCLMSIRYAVGRSFVRPRVIRAGGSAVFRR